MKVIHCNFLSVNHGFRDNEFFLQAGYDNLIVFHSNFLSRTIEALGFRSKTIREVQNQGQRFIIQSLKFDKHTFPLTNIRPRARVG